MKTRVAVRVAVLSLPALCALCAVALAAGAAAQEPLFAPPLHPALAETRNAEPGDLNEDGYMDLLVCDTGPHVMLSLGGDGFAPPVAVAGGAGSVQLADVNNDGHLDIVGVNGFDDVIRVSLGAGDATFTPFADYPCAQDPRDLAIADFNGDGNLDIASPGLHTLRVSVNHGNGDGTFGPKLDYGPVGDSAYKITAADINGDGTPDIAVSSRDHDQVSMIYSDGKGGLALAAPVLLDGDVEDAGAIDLDDDGDLDLVIHMVTGGLRVVMNTGGGVFANQSFFFPLPFGEKSPLVVRDFDEDGRDDVALGIGERDMVWVYRSTGLAGAAALEVEGTFMTGNNPVGLSCADMDGDGDPDLIASNINGGNVRILRGEGDGSFLPAAGGWTAGVTNVRGVATGDLNGDGHVDLVTFGGGQGFSVALNTGYGHFPKSVRWGLPLTYHLDGLVADFNGDGLQDVAAANASFASQSATIFLGAGNGLPLAAKNYVPPTGNWSWIDAADFDGDGDRDIVLGRDEFQGPGSVHVAFNDGAGNLSPGPMLDTLQPIATSVCAADFDDDGAPDVAVSTGSSTIAVFLGDGTGGFAAPIHRAGASGFDLDAGDFDGDGILDLAVVANDQVAVYEGVGDGSFGSASLHAAPNDPYGLAIADLDHDGILDLVTANSHPFDILGTLSVFIGGGDGSFGPATQYATGQFPWQVAVADLDRDGWNDLVAAPQAGPDVMLNRRGPWNELGHGLAGTLGIPRQTGAGPMVPGQPFKFTLRDARPSTIPYHVIGIAQLQAPFKGGVMVPTVNLINPFPATNAQGTVEVGALWVNAPSGLTLYFQFWLPDPNGPLNFAASTAVSATLP